MTEITDFREMQRVAWEIAENGGFHEGSVVGKDDRPRPTILALIHSEVSEALEADREQDDSLYAEELADIVIRVIDHAETEGIDLCAEINWKMDVNLKREFKHGKTY